METKIIAALLLVMVVLLIVRFLIFYKRTAAKLSNWLDEERKNKSILKHKASEIITSLRQQVTDYLEIISRLKKKTRKQKKTILCLRAELEFNDLKTQFLAYNLKQIKADYKALKKMNAALFESNQQLIALLPEDVAEAFYSGRHEFIQNVVKNSTASKKKERAH